MKRALIIIFMAASLTLTMSGCVREDSLRLVAVEDLDVTIRSTPKIDAWISVENTLRRNITLRDVVVTLSRPDGQAIAKVKVAGEIAVPKRAITTVHIPAYASLSDPVAALSLVRNLKKGSEGVYIEISGHAKIGSVGRNFNTGRMRLSELIATFGSKGIFDIFDNQRKNLDKLLPAFI